MGRNKVNNRTVAPPPETGNAQASISDQALVYAQDLKQLLRQQRQTQATLDRLRMTFMGVVNHELRSPLALIFQALEILEDPRLGALTDEQLDAVAILRRQGQTLGKMIENLTSVAAFLSKQEIVQPVMSRLEDVLGQVLPLAEFKARSKTIALETEIELNLPPLLLDPKQMEEALIQLLDNAIKFNRPGGTIKVSARVMPHWIVIDVVDTGIGIEAEQMELIWQTFEQGIDPLRRAQEGLGLGLALTRYIIVAHEGTIEVETKLGCGSTFRVKLPLLQEG